MATATGPGVRAIAERTHPAETTVGAALAGAARRWPDLCGWVFEDRRVSFGEMHRLADKVVAGLRSIGVRHGDTVALWTPNLIEWAAASFACYRIGAVVTSLNTRFKAFESQHVLGHSQARVLIVQPRLLGIDFEEILEQAAPGITVAENGHVSAPALPYLERLVAVGPGRLPALPFEQLLATPAPADDRSYPVPDPDTACLIQYTSGTTSLPKGALLSNRHVLNYAVETFERLGVGVGDPVLNTQPVYHIGGSSALTVPLLLGCTMVTMSHYDPLRALELIERESCVSRSGIPTMYLMELAHPRFNEFDLGSLRSGWTGGPPAVMDRIREGFGGIELVQLYGASEGGGTAGSVGDAWADRRVSAGRPLTGTEIRLVDPDTGAEAEVGAVGEVCIRGWNRMIGYYRDEERSNEVIDEDGWLHMGDLGRFDDNGNFYYIGRLKEMIRVGGENTSAEEVESLLMEHDAIAQAAVIGVPDERMGEVVLAIVERAPGATLTAAEVMAHCKTRAANFRVPRHVRFVTDWPYTGSGKIAKQALRDMFLPEFDDSIDDAKTGH